MLLATALVAMSGCGGSVARSSTLPATLPSTDAPYELAYDQDLQMARDRYQALAPGDQARAALRAALADEYARRVRAALEAPDQLQRAHEMLMELASMWTPAELEAGAPGMEAYVDEARAARDVLARAGADLEAAAALYFLQAADPAARQAADSPYLDEIQEIFAYADALAVARFGDGAERSRPIEILAAVLEGLPSRPVVDALVAQVHERQSALLARFRSDGPSADLIHAHGAGVFRASWSVVRALARAGRLEEAPAALKGLETMGTDADMAGLVDAALAPDAGEEQWLALAAAFQHEDPEQADPGAALQVCLEGARRLPGSAALAYAAAEIALAIDRPSQAVALYERGMALAPGRDAAETLADLYSTRVAVLALAERPHAALEQLAALERFHAQAARRWPGKPLKSDLAQAYAAMGRGMVGLGELATARRYLERSVTQRRNHEALALLGTIALKQDRFREARQHLDAALALPADGVYLQLERARVLRLAGDAAAGMGDGARAARHWAQALEAWLTLAQAIDLPPRFQGEMLVESARAHWALGDRDTALRAFEAAVDVDTDGEDTHTSVVSFLITRGDYERALDAYHRALGNYEISDYAKVYMSLWMLAEARRRGEAPDALAEEFLAGREGALWYDDLARYATGRLGLGALQARAGTRGRRAELAYYTAVLGDPGGPRAVRSLLERVLATDMVLFFEYDMAKHWLGQGADELRRASR